MTDSRGPVGLAAKLGISLKLIAIVKDGAGIADLIEILGLGPVIMAPDCIRGGLRIAGHVKKLGHCEGVEAVVREGLVGGLGAGHGGNSVLMYPP
jgi:hypothetical protein